MHRLIPLLLLVISLSATACGPSEEDCNELCEWWSQYCTGETIQSCIDDCLDSSSDDVSYARNQCLDFSASGCKGASCCLRFVYTEYYYSTNCL